MRQSFVDSEEYAWIGDIVVYDPQPPADDEIMALAETIEDGGAEIVLKVFPDFSIVAVEENLRLYRVARFLHYSRIKIHMYPFKKGQTAVPPRRRRSTLTPPRVVRAGDIALEVPEPPPYDEEPLEEDDIP